MSGKPLLDSFLHQGGALALAVIIAVVAATLTYLSEQSKQRRESKIKTYEALIRSIGDDRRTAATDTDAEKRAAALEVYSDASMVFCVWADKAVLTALSEYIRNSTNKADPAKQSDVVLLRKDFARLVAAMRQDIGIESAVNDAVGTIAFGDEWDKWPPREPKAEGVRV